MRAVNPIWHFVAAFAIAVLLYAVVFLGIEQARHRRGPWQVRFAMAANQHAVIGIDHPGLGIRNVTLIFPDVTVSSTNLPMTWEFSEPKPVPHDAPFGQVLFTDLTFLPGTVTFNLFGHEVELLRRVLIIDKREHPWKSNQRIEVRGQGVLPPRVTSLPTAGKSRRK